MAIDNPDKDAKLIADLRAITRYDISIGGAGDEYEYLDVERDQEGEWVKYEDIATIIESCRKGAE
jgi:hypothetical protein